jgi:hypothetical protein
LDGAVDRVKVMEKSMAITASSVLKLTQLLEEVVNRGTQLQGRVQCLETKLANAETNK